MLVELLRQKIKDAGSISLYDYMALCLYHPQEGYYMRQVPMGESGDFITAPEISQLFGEIIGAYLVQYYREHLENKKITLAELGPGKGTLMQDILRVFSLRPTIEKTIKLLEISPTLRAHQQKVLEEEDVEWYTDLEKLLEDAAPAPLLLIANEFLDALPANQYTYINKAWHQRHVTWENNTFRFCWKPCEKAPYNYPATETIYEHTPDAPKVLQCITQYLKAHGGMAIFIDYGYTNGTGDSLQAMAQHKYASVLASPGQADLTTHVNFGWLKELAEAEGCVTSLTTQGTFLSQLGVQLRAQQLMQKASPDGKLKLQRQLDHLLEKMGEVFKVLVVQNPT